MTIPTARGAPALHVAAALTTVYLVWGSTYLGIAIMIETLPPLLAAGVRYFTAGALMIAFLAARARLAQSRGGASLERPSWANVRATFIVGALLLLGGNGGVVLAELTIPSGVAAVIIATVPIWLAVFEAVLTRRAPTLLVVGGLLAGIAGVAILLVPVEGIDDLDPLGIALAVGAAISWSIGSLYARRAPLPRSGLLATGMEMVAGGLVLAGAGLLLGELARTDPTAFSARSLVAVIYLIIFGSILGFTAYTWLLQNVSVTTAGTYAYVNPIVAVLLGALVLSEPITLRSVLATVIVIAAVVVMVSGRPRAVEEAGPGPETATSDRVTEPAGGTDPAARHGA